MNGFTNKIAAAVAVTVAGIAGSTQASPLINEVYFNAPGSTDPTVQYIELRGTPGESLANYYLLVVENERALDDPDTAGVNETLESATGQIDHVFNLGALTTSGVTAGAIGNNGYSTLLTRSSSFIGKTALGSNTYVNTQTGSDGVGFGQNSTQLAHQGGTQLEGSGGTFMLIKVDTSISGTVAPSFLTQDDQITDLDLGNDGLDPFATTPGRQGWTIVDSVGVLGEPSELNGLLYGSVNFAPGVLTTPQPGTVNINTMATSPTFSEIEYVARWGDSTTTAASSWVAANLTDNGALGADGGYTSANRNYGVSGSHGNPGSNPEIYRGFTSAALPYGTDMTTTLGSVNKPGPLFAPPVLLDDAPSGTSQGTATVNGNPATNSYVIGEVDTPDTAGGLKGFVTVNGDLSTSGDAPVFVLLDINGDGNSATAEVALKNFLNGVVGKAYTAYTLSDDADGVLAAYQTGVNGDYDLVLKFAAVNVPGGDSAFYFNYDLSTSEISALGVNSLNYVGVVPEPSSLGLIGVGALAMLKRRRRAEVITLKSAADAV